MPDKSSLPSPIIAPSDTQSGWRKCLSIVAISVKKIESLYQHHITWYEVSHRDRAQELFLGSVVTTHNGKYGLILRGAVGIRQAQSIGEGAVSPLCDETCPCYEYLQLSTPNIIVPCGFFNHTFQVHKTCSAFPCHLDIRYMNNFISIFVFVFVNAFIFCNNFESSEDTFLIKNIFVV